MGWQLPEDGSDVDVTSADSAGLLHNAAPSFAHAPESERQKLRATRPGLRGTLTVQKSDVPVMLTRMVEWFALSCHQADCAPHEVLKQSVNTVTSRQSWMHACLAG